MQAGIIQIKVVMATKCEE
jgi:hypothetical protein